MGQSAQNLFQTPEQVAMERVKQQQAMFAAAQSPYERMGLAIGNILGGALGIKDPAMERASTIQSVYNAVLQNNPDTTSASFYTELANTLSAAGLSQEANFALQEARKYQMQERDFGLREREVGARERQVSGETVTTKGIRVFRRGGGPLQVEEGGKDVAYDPEKHGRFETASDRISNKGVQIRDIPGPGGIGVIGREVFDSNTGATIRREYFGQQPGAAPAATTPAATGATWNYVPGKGMVKAP